METFACWYGLLKYLEEHNNMVYYKAPLDNYPVPVVVTKVFKNEKLRIQFLNKSFTADPGHLGRFLWKV